MKNQILRAIPNPMTNPSISVDHFKSRLLCVFLLVFLPVLAYFNTLKGSFQFDDEGLLERSWVSDLDHFREGVSLATVINRPVLLFTYAVNNTLHRGDVFGFHLLNLLLHVLTSILVFHILWRSQRLLRPEERAGPPLVLPLGAALLFALHPLNTEAVSYISSRSSVLSAFFYLLTLRAFLAIFSPAVSPAAPEAPKPAKQIALALFCLLGFYLALASKLVAVTLPVLLGVWFFAVVDRRSSSELRAWVFSGRAVPFAVAATLGAAFAVFYVLYEEGWLSPRDQGFLLFGRAPYFLVQNKVIVFYYLKKFFFPFNLNVDVGFPFSSFWADPAIPLAVLLILGSVAWALLRGDVFLKIGVLGFLIALAPTSSVIPLNDLAAERWLYLPLAIGLCPAAGWAIARMGRTRGLAFAVFLFAAFGLLTAARNAVWLDELALWKDAAEKNPRSPRPENNLGKARYLNAERLAAGGDAEGARVERERALAHFQKSLDNLSGYAEIYYNKEQLRRHLDQLASPELKRSLNLGGGSGEGQTNPDLSGPENGGPQNRRFPANLAEPHYNIASLYLDLGRHEDAEREYRIALRINPDYSEAYVGLGSVYNRTLRYDKAVEFYQQAIEARKRATGEEDYPLARLNLGEAYGKMGRYREAIAELNRAVRFSPSLDKAHYNLGVAYAELGEYDEAERAYLACLKINGRFAEARFNLARLYQSKKEWDRSTREYEKFIEFKGPDAKAYFQIGWNRQQAGRRDEAKDFYLKALARDPAYLSARVNLGLLYLESKQYDPAIEAFEAALRQRPDMYLLHRQAGLIYREAGKDKAKAAEHLAKALELNPAQEGAGELSKIIKELSPP